MRKPATYFYWCSVHLNMRARIQKESESEKRLRPLLLCKVDIPTDCVAYVCKLAGMGGNSKHQACCKNDIICYKYSPV